MRNQNISNLPSIVKLGIEEYIKNMHTSMPGIIESFNSVTQTCSVQPAIKRIFKHEDGETTLLIPTNLPLLINVPVVFPRGGGFSMTFPVAKGDECRLDFSERCIDLWHEFGGVQKPGARRFHNLSDAIATVGLSSKPNKIPNFDPDNIQIKKDDGTAVITVYADGNIRFKADTKVTIETPDTELTGNTVVKGNLTVEGNTALGATVTSNGVNISETHVHAQGNDSSGDTQQNTGVPQ